MSRGIFTRRNCPKVMSIIEFGSWVLTPTLIQAIRTVNFHNIEESDNTDENN